MNIRVELTREPVTRPDPPVAGGTAGAWVEFAGIVRGEEAGATIAALEYEAYDTMARRVMREQMTALAARHGCQSAHVIHRVGIIPVGDVAVWVGVASAHRNEALAFIAGFMDRLKQDVPIWKRRAVTADDP